MNLLVAAVVILIFAWVAWRLLDPPADVVIRWSSPQLRLRGRLAEVQKRELHEFLRNEFADCCRLTIRGFRDRFGSMHWKINGPIAPGDEQRIRNFLRLARR